MASEIVNNFKMHGLTLRSDAKKYLVDTFKHVGERQKSSYLEKIIESIQKQPLSSSMISRDACEIAFRECNAEQDDSQDEVLTIIDAFSVPRFTYNADRKKFIPDSTLGLPEPVLHGSADDKHTLFKNRYTILHQRTLRHDFFTPPVLGSHTAQQTQKFQLKPIEYLLGCTAKVGEVIVLGMISQLKEGKWFLEDPTGNVQLDITNAGYHTGLFTESCFVLAEGWYEDGIFHVKAFGFPPSETSSTTRNFFGSINFFGGPSATCAKASVMLKKIEEDNEDAMMIFISDVWLDSVKVLEKLRTLFTGFSEAPPLCFIFCGNFTSIPQGYNTSKVLKESFRNLAELLCEFPTLVENCKFIFIPGTQDPGPTSIFPRPAIPNSITEEIRRKVPSIFTSNPCRIQYCTQEIVVFREDIVTKMCRNCMKFPTDGDVPSHFAKTIVCQAHLCPLPLHVCPIYWSYDCGLRLYPLPDLVVCADKFDAFQATNTDCCVMNPVLGHITTIFKPDSVTFCYTRKKIDLKSVPVGVRGWMSEGDLSIERRVHMDEEQYFSALRDHCNSGALIYSDGLYRCNKPLVCSCPNLSDRESFLRQILTGKGYKHDCLFGQIVIRKQNFAGYYGYPNFYYANNSPGYRAQFYGYHHQ